MIMMTLRLLNFAEFTLSVHALTSSRRTLLSHFTKPNSNWMTFPMAMFEFEMVDKWVFSKQTLALKTQKNVTYMYISERH